VTGVDPGRMKINLATVLRTTADIDSDSGLLPCPITALNKYTLDVP